jgi:hypothetical protein
LSGGELEDPAGSEGKLTGNSEPAKDLCRQVEDRAQFRGRRLGFSMVTTIQTFLLEEERSREAEAKILWAIQIRQGGRRGGIRAKTTGG